MDEVDKSRNGWETQAGLGTETVSCSGWEPALTPQLDSGTHSVLGGSPSEPHLGAGELCSRQSTKNIRARGGR